MSTTTSKKDPWDLDVKAQGSIRDEMRSTRQRALCRSMNKGIGERCFGCEKVAQMFASRDPLQMNTARQNKANPSLYLNVVFPENLSKVVLLEIGGSVGNEIINGIEKQEWGSITSQKGKGREIKITKIRTSSSSYPTYKANPALNPVEYDIPESTLAKRHNLSNIIDLLDTEEVFRIASLRVDETLTFKILPAWDDGKGNKKIMKPVWYHWGFSDEQVKGEEEIHIEDEAEEPEKKEVPWEDTSESVESEPAGEMGASEKDPCFGKIECFDAEDDTCKDCADFNECKAVVAKLKKAKKLEKIEE